MTSITYPYLPPGRTIEYVHKSDRFMAYARLVALCDSMDHNMPGAAVIARGDDILGAGANGSDFHEKNECARVRLKCKTGEGYELCEGCHPNNHSEVRAIQNTAENAFDPKGADLYLWGHWWCCMWCWNAMMEAGINRVFLLQDSEILFNREHPNNAIGRQFAATE